MNKNAISSLTASIALLSVAVVAFISFQVWFTNFSDDVFQEHTGDVNSDSIVITSLDASDLYVRNYANLNITYTNITIGSAPCNSTGSIAMISITQIDISTCVASLDAGPKEVVIYTNSGVFFETMVLPE